MDYVTSSTSVTLDRVSSNAIVIFSIVNDSAIELSEKFFGVLSLVQSGGYYSRVTVDPAATIITIEDDDGNYIVKYWIVKSTYKNIPLTFIPLDRYKLN